MSVRSAQSITTTFTTRTPSTSAATNADSTPTGTLYVNGTADAASVTVTNLATGKYKAAVTLPTLAIGDVVNLVIAVVMGGVTDNAKVWEETCDLSLDSSGRVDVSKFGGSAGTFASGRPEVNTARLNGATFNTPTIGNDGAVKTGGSRGSILPKPGLDVDTRLYTTTYADSVAISGSVSDGVGGGADSVAGVSNPPTMKLNDGINGFPCFRFTKASSQKLTFPYTGPIGTAIAIVNCRTADADQALLGIDSASGTDGALHITLNDGASPNGIAAKRVTASGGTDGKASFTTADSTESAMVGVPAAIGVEINGSQVALIRQGFALPPVTMAGAPLAASTGITVGGRYVSGSLTKFADVDLYHLRVYKEVLTQEQRVEALREMGWALGPAPSEGQKIITGHLITPDGVTQVEQFYFGLSEGGRRCNGTFKASYKPAAYVRDPVFEWCDSLGLWVLGYTDQTFDTHDNKLTLAVALDPRFWLRLPQNAITTAISPPAGFQSSADRVWNSRIVNDDGLPRIQYRVTFKTSSVFNDMNDVWSDITAFDIISGFTLAEPQVIYGSTLFGGSVVGEGWVSKGPDGYLWDGTLSNRYRAQKLGGPWVVETITTDGGVGPNESPRVIKSGDKGRIMLASCFGGSSQGMYRAFSSDGGKTYGVWSQIISGNPTYNFMAGTMVTFRRYDLDRVRANEETRALMRRDPVLFKGVILSATARTITLHGSDDTLLTPYAWENKTIQVYPASGADPIGAVIQDAVSDENSGGILVTLTNSYAGGYIPAAGDLAIINGKPSIGPGTFGALLRGRALGGSTTSLIFPAAWPNSSTTYKNKIIAVETTLGRVEYVIPTVRTSGSPQTWTVTPTLITAPVAPSASSAGTMLTLYGALAPWVDTSGQVTFNNTSIATVASVTAIASGGITSSSFAANSITAAATAADYVTEVQNGLSTLNAAGVRSAIGMANADLDTQLGTLATTSALSAFSSATGTALASLATGQNTIAGYLDTEIDAIKAKSDLIGTNAADSPNQVTAQGTISLNLDAKVSEAGGGGGNNLTITPVVANSSNPRYSTRAMANLAQGSAPTDIWTFVDSAGAAIDLSGKTIRLVFATATSLGDDDAEAGNNPVDDTLVGSFKYETGAGLTTGGTSHNQVTLVHSATKLATAGNYRFFWWNVTDKILLAKGSVSIEPTVFDV